MEWPIYAGRSIVSDLPAGTWLVTVEAADGQGTVTLLPGDNPELVLP